MIKLILISFIVPYFIGIWLNRGIGVRLSNRDKKILGLAGGIAQRFNWDSTVVRVVMVLLILLPFISIPAYFMTALGVSKK
ncbi:phage shock protein C (PspC) family protein [Pilibacter termitis]|uniref:Phage shock protein C (PspC) family protein n=1 Tax=Pilibacter termitis TaxID=263852 RepID=A0A1T4NM75_9ENTE|nr:PspC domain-containing protein [Pilibacter termitis]SJZ80302.1 phage shock protein C (PspC) family protein [Pilibacter termitis]